MADILPKFMVIQSVAEKKYAVYSTEPAPKYICTKCEDVFNPYVRIEVEIAKINRKYVHLRFYHSNRYWAKCADGKWLVSVSNQPDENKSEPSCTMFEPTIGSNDSVSFTHVQSGGRLKIDPSCNRIYVDDCDSCHEYAFSFVDWDTLVKIPKRVAFKGDNGKYIKAFYNGNNAFTFASLDCNEKFAAFEVTLQPDGYIRIKSVSYGKFLRYNSFSPSWLVADWDDHKGGNTEDLFWPVRIDNFTIALRNAKIDKFCIQDNLSLYFQATGESMVKEAKLVVEELVLERKICNVEYRMEDARVYDELPFVAGTGTAVNKSDQESSMTITFTFEHTQTYSFTATQCAYVGIHSIIEAGIPGIVYGKIEVSACVTNTLEWGTTTEDKTTALATYTTKVPPNSRVTVNYVGTRGNYSVPFSYTQRDKCSLDGKVSNCRRIDGVFLGVNSYNFNFEELPIESILPPKPPC